MSFSFFLSTSRAAKQQALDFLLQHSVGTPIQVPNYIYMCRCRRTCRKNVERVLERARLKIRNSQRLKNCQISPNFPPPSTSSIVQPDPEMPQWEFFELKIQLTESQRSSKCNKRAREQLFAINHFICGRVCCYNFKTPKQQPTR